jgi:hypothetical protein
MGWLPPSAGHQRARKMITTAAGIGAAEFCARYPECLNNWETGFINNIVKWRRTPTSPQLDVLEQIRARIQQQQQERA